jgi:hypothetical protein
MRIMRLLEAQPQMRNTRTSKARGRRDCFVTETFTFGCVLDMLERVCSTSSIGAYRGGDPKGKGEVALTLSEGFLPGDVVTCTARQNLAHAMIVSDNTGPNNTPVFIRPEPWRPGV